MRRFSRSIELKVKQLKRSWRIVDPRSEVSLRAAICSELRDALIRILAKLSAYRRRTIELHFGLFDGISYTSDQIASIMRWSPSRARAVINTTLLMLQRQSTKNALAGFLPGHQSPDPETFSK